MDRREFLMSVGASLIPRIIRVSTSLTPFQLVRQDMENAMKTYERTISLYAIHYFMDNSFVGAWSGIKRDGHK